MSWRWSIEKLKRQNNDVILSSDDINYSIYKKQRPTIGELPSKKPKSIFYKPEYSSGNGTAQLKDIFGDKVFNNAKPVELIKDFIKIGSNRNSLVLDFFAGSGTIGHAVMKLNAEDNGNRNFILCTNNENNICRGVTYERIKRVIKNENYPASLKYYKIDFVPISEQIYYEYADTLLLHIRELVELENGVNFAGNPKVAIVLTDAEISAFFKGIETKKMCRKLYISHDLLLTEEQEKILGERKIKICIIPQYYYRNEEES